MTSFTPILTHVDGILTVTFFSCDLWKSSAHSWWESHVQFQIAALKPFFLFGFLRKREHGQNLLVTTPTHTMRFGGFHAPTLASSLRTWRACNAFFIPKAWSQIWESYWYQNTEHLVGTNQTAFSVLWFIWQLSHHLCLPSYVKLAKLTAYLGWNHQTRGLQQSTEWDIHPRGKFSHPGGKSVMTRKGSKMSHPTFRGKWSFTVSSPIKDGDFPVRYVSLLEGMLIS